MKICMKIWGLRPSSLKPPALSIDDYAAAQEKLSYVLLEAEAYVAKRDNATTAFSKTCDDKRIQVTLCPCRPPRLSYVCVHSPDAAEINLEPTILAAEEFILLRVTVGAKGRKIENIDYYVYQADGAEGPSLTLLPRPPSGYHFDSSTIGILGYGPDGCRAYILAGLNEACWWQPEGQFDFCIYDSKQGLWKTLNLSFSPAQLKRHGGKKFCHVSSKVMAAGDAGTMAFVDLWRGIVFLDVLQARGEATVPPSLHYVKLPRPLQSNKTLEGDARLYRDIAVIGNRLKYVELQVHYKASVLCEGQFFRNGWMAATWTRQANNFTSGGWEEQNRIMDSQDLKVDSEMYFELLPKMQNDEGTTLSPFKGLDVCQPVLSLGGGGMDTIYFTAKRRRGEAEGWVVSVDLENKELLGVSSFPSERYRATNFAYVHSSISKHLKSDPGEEESFT